MKAVSSFRKIPCRRGAATCLGPISNLRTIPALRRSISSVKHMTKAELELFHSHAYRKFCLPRPPVSQTFIRPRAVRFHLYDLSVSKWMPMPIDSQPGLEYGRILTVVSWNIDAFAPDAMARAKTILDCLQNACKNPPRSTVIMLQEVSQRSLQAILEDSWVRQNFKISNVDAPASISNDIVGSSFVMKRLDWRAVPYFSVMMISNDLPVSSSHRVPFVTGMGRDALVADVPMTTKSTKTKDVLRLCTTHLESLYEGRAYRPGQLALIAALLRGESLVDRNVVAGLVAGDMNAIDKSEHEYPKAEDVQLQDAWENGPEEVVLTLKPFQRDLTNGQARGNTWGYQQESGKRDGKRMDKILFTGCLKTVPLRRGDQLTRGIKRLGVDLQTTVEAIKWYDLGWSKKWKPRFMSLERVDGTRRQLSGGQTRTSTTVWVSDHYGILATLRILQPSNKIQSNA